MNALRSTRWNPNVFAAQGYVVVAINPTGSTGYGQDFTNAIAREWGGKPYKDLVAGLEYVKSVYKDMIDGERMVMLGAVSGDHARLYLSSLTDIVEQSHTGGSWRQAVFHHEYSTKNVDVLLCDLLELYAGSQRHYQVQGLCLPRWCLRPEAGVVFHRCTVVNGARPR